MYSALVIDPGDALRRTYVLQRCAGGCGHPPGIVRMTATDDNGDAGGSGCHYKYEHTGQ